MSKIIAQYEKYGITNDKLARIFEFVQFRGLKVNDVLHENLIILGIVGLRAQSVCL